MRSRATVNRLKMYKSGGKAVRDDKGRVRNRENGRRREGERVLLNINTRPRSLPRDETRLGAAADAAQCGP